MIELIQGEFACCIVMIEKSTQRYEVFLGRDHIGVRPLFFARSPA
jgi:asparagine synthetase B (glutamine-hydrolysing)